MSVISSSVWSDMVIISQRRVGKGGVVRGREGEEKLVVRGEGEVSE